MSSARFLKIKFVYKLDLMAEIAFTKELSFNDSSKKWRFRTCSVHQSFGFSLGGLKFK